MPRRSPSLTILACSLLLLTPALAQQQTPTIRTSTRIVYVDVVVRDRSGHIVRNLDKSSFSLTEDGKPQRIDLFELHTGAIPKPAPTRGPDGLVSNLPANSRDLSLNLVLFDLLDTDPTDQAFARERMISFLRALPPRQTGRPLRPLQPASHGPGRHLRLRHPRPRRPIHRPQAAQSHPLPHPAKPRSRH